MIPQMKEDKKKKIVGEKRTKISKIVPEILKKVTYIIINSYFL